MLRLFLCVMVSFITVQISAQAAVTLVSNIANPKGEEDRVFEGYSQYQSFQTGSSAATIQGIQLSFGYVGNPSGIGVAVFSDVNGQVGSALASFAPVGAPGSMSYQNYDFSGSLNVNANTNYWVVLSATGDTGAWYEQNFVSFTGDVSEVGLAGWTLANSYWTLINYYYGEPSSLTEEHSGNSIQMTISGSVPEPSSLSLLVLGIGSLALLRRRI
jgi:hypothetical protein